MRCIRIAIRWVCALFSYDGRTYGSVELYGLQRGTKANGTTQHAVVCFVSCQQQFGLFGDDQLRNHRGTKSVRITWGCGAPDAGSPNGLNKGACPTLSLGLQLGRSPAFWHSLSEFPATESTLVGDTRPLNFETRVASSIHDIREQILRHPFPCIILANYPQGSRTRNRITLRYPRTCVKPMSMQPPLHSARQLRTFVPLSGQRRRS